MLSFPSHCAVCGQPFFLNHECPALRRRASCTPPAHEAPAVAPVDSLPAPAEAGGGECAS